MQMQHAKIVKKRAEIFRFLNLLDIIILLYLKFDIKKLGY